MAIGSLLLLWFSGAYLTARMSAWGLGWPKVAAAAMLLITPLGAASGRCMRAIPGGITNQEAGESATTPQLISRALYYSLYVRICVVAGIVLLMAAKPDTTESAVIIAASAVLGSASALLASRRVKTLRIPSTNTSRAS